MATFLWSDTHFNHAGILKHCAHRPWLSVRDMNSGLISLWNRKVGPTDTIWLLGDFAFKSGQGDRVEDIFAHLNGHKCLVVGNHDEQNPGVLKLPWERVERLYTFKENGARAELCHYPLTSWKRAQHGALMLHGHCHGNLQEKLAHRYDVGVDALGSDGPVRWETLVEMAAKEVFVATDHHVRDDM